MYVQVKTMDGNKMVTINTSKTMKIIDFKIKVAYTMDVSPERQRLFFRGKQLEDCYALFDYNINLNDVIQLMVKPCLPNLDCRVKPNLCISLKRYTVPSSSNKENEELSISKYYKVGDLVDAIDKVYGAWFEGKIVSIVKNQNGNNEQKHDSLLYEVEFVGALEDEQAVLLPLTAIRPRAKEYLKVDNLQTGDMVMVNYNIEEPKRRGYWFDCLVEKINIMGKFKSITGCIYFGLDRTSLNNCEVLYMDDIMKIESHKLLSECMQEITDEESEALRVSGPYCSTCNDNPRHKCKECGCHICGCKDNPSKQIMCDECNRPYHLWCLKPQLETIPDDDEWYCPDCKNDENEVVKAGEKLKESKKKSKMASQITNSTRDWGKGMACVGRTKECTIVPSNHFGPIPGVEVGTSWKFRLQVSEAGVHRPCVAGIHGRETEGAYSIVLSGGYEDDVDDGDEFLYTGSGGRDLSGNKRTSIQSCDQQLTRFNKALALNCKAPLNVNGAEAVDWCKGKPVRVVRNFKLSKHSKYAPTEGNRYDGIYKVVKYYKEKGMSGFDVWRFVLRRDDPSPAPWTKKGKARILSSGLEMIYPVGYLEAMGDKEMSPMRDRGTKRVLQESNDEENIPAKKFLSYTLNKEIEELIKQDVENKKVWQFCKTALEEGRQKFRAKVEEYFTCICCLELLYDPVTTTCNHNICMVCIKRSYLAEVYTCPYCRHDFGKDYKFKKNIVLSKILLALFPGYEVGR